MMRKMLQSFVVGVSAVGVVGCVGMPLNEIREQKPSVNFITHKTRDTVVQCLEGSLEKYIEKVSRYDDRTDISIGAYQLGSFKHYYLIGISDGKVSLRDTDRRYLPLSRAELMARIDSCLN